MKFTLKLSFLCFAFSFFAACNNAPQGEEAQTGEEVETAAAVATTEGTMYQVATGQSKINWVGSKLVGKKHTGYLLLQGGTLKMNEGQLTGGEFVVDMASLTDEDLEPGSGKEKLEGHLKSDDFFDVANYPTATFVIAEAKPVEGQPDVTHEITGNLTMKGITKSITIPAKVSVSENAVTAQTPQFTIDRTKWKVMYGAGVLGVAQDEIISDKVGLQINLTAMPQGESPAAEGEEMESK